MLLARFTEESNEQKSENQTLKFQASNLTFGIVPLSTLWLKTLKTLFLLLSHIIKLDLEAFPFLIRFCPVLLLKKYFALNTSFFLPVTSIIPVPPLLFLLHPLVATEISRSCCVRCPKSQKNHTQDFYTSDPIFSLWVIELLKISCTMQSKSSFSVGSIDYSPLWQHFLGLLRGDAHFFQLHCVFLIFWMLWGHWIFTESFIKLNSTSIHFHRPVCSMAFPSPVSPFLSSLPFSLQEVSLRCVFPSALLSCACWQTVTCSWDHSDPITEQSCMWVVRVDWEHLSQVL